jgi:hypothetical protein
MNFDSAGYGEDGKPVLHAKFEDAYSQLEKKKVSLEKFLHANFDISVLNNQKPMILEFERWVARESFGNSEFVFDSSWEGFSWTYHRIAQRSTPKAYKVCFEKFFVVPMASKCLQNCTGAYRGTKNQIWTYRQ